MPDSRWREERAWVHRWEERSGAWMRGGWGGGGADWRRVKKREEERKRRCSHDFSSFLCERHQEGKLADKGIFCFAPRSPRKFLPRFVHLNVEVFASFCAWNCHDIWIFRVTVVLTSNENITFRCLIVHKYYGVLISHKYYWEFIHDITTRTLKLLLFHMEVGKLV